MGFNYQLLAVFFVMHLLQGEIGCDPPYDHKEGVIGTYDVVFADCTYDRKGTATIEKEAEINFTLINPGSVFTYIEAINKKPPGQQPNITKTGGGLNQRFVNFLSHSTESHGFMFQFKLYGKPAPGKK